MSLVPSGVSSSSISDFAKRATEAAGLTAAVLYALGMLRTVGELRELHLSTPTVLAGFEHSDMLMKGVGVLASHLASLLLMLAAIALFTSRVALDGLNRRLLHGNRTQNLVAVIVGGVLLLLASRVWEGVAFTAIAIALALTLVLRQRTLSRAMALTMVGVGLALIGLVGSYLHAPPPSRATVDRDGDKPLHGLLIGKGAEGDWYLATNEDGTYRLEVIGGSVESPTSVSVHPAHDEGYRTLAAEIADRL